MSVDPLEQPLEASVPPVQVNPFGDAQAHDHVVLRPLSQKKIVVLQYVIGLKERRDAMRKTWPWLNGLVVVIKKTPETNTLGVFPQLRICRSTQWLKKN